MWLKFQSFIFFCPFLSRVDARKDVKDATRLVIWCPCLSQAQELLSKDMCDVMKMQRPTGMMLGTLGAM